MCLVCEPQTKASVGGTNEGRGIDLLDDNTKDKLFFVIDNIIQNTKAKKALAS